MEMSMDKQAPQWKILVAFAALYLIWGSTYLGIKIAIETMPPFLMATTRFLAAGLILYGIYRIRGGAKPNGEQWRHSLVVGGFLIAGGNGIVTFAQQWIDSSMAALIITTNPLFMMVFGWWGKVQGKPSLRAWISLAVGFAGVALLLGSDGDEVSNGSFFGYALVFVAILFWTLGSVYSKKKPQTIDPWLQSGMQMICGGGVCLVAGLLWGEFEQADVSAFSLRSYIAFAYLIFFGSLAGFTSYVYLLRHRSPSAVSSHAYVNPVVAVLLGWLILDETLTIGGMIGSGLVLISVFELLRQK